MDKEGRKNGWMKKERKTEKKEGRKDGKIKKGGWNDGWNRKEGRMEMEGLSLMDEK